MPKPTGSSNPNIKEIIDMLRSKRVKLYSKLADYISGRPRNGVNLSKIDRVSKKNESVVVPLKVLGGGKITKPVMVYSIKFSHSAAKKIIAANGKCMSLKEMVEKGDKPRVVI